jgi:GH35 family endo-1,4-beta-xylanase
LHRYQKERDSLNHVQAVLIKGLEDNYAWMGQHWPDSRYLVISLSFDAQGGRKASPVDRGLALRL